MRRFGFRWGLLTLSTLSVVLPLSYSAITDTEAEFLREFVLRFLHAPAMLVAWKPFDWWLDHCFIIFGPTPWYCHDAFAVVAFSWLLLCIAALWYLVGRWIDRRLGWLPSFEHPLSKVHRMLAWVSLSVLVALAVWLPLGGYEVLTWLFEEGMMAEDAKVVGPLAFPLALWSAVGAVAVALELRRWHKLARSPR